MFITILWTCETNNKGWPYFSVRYALQEQNYGIAV